MRAHLISRILMPHGGLYAIHHPLTGAELKGTHFEMLWNNYVNYNRANSLPVGLDDEDMIEAMVCEKYPDACEVSRRNMGLPLVAPGLYDVVRGSMVMMNHKAHDSMLVPQAEANRRAEICFHCKLRAQMTLPCTRCITALENVVQVITGSHSTPHDERLSCCSICKCFISASVWLPLETQCIGVSEEMREKFAFAKEAFNCWKNC